VETEAKPLPKWWLYWRAYKDNDDDGVPKAAASEVGENVAGAAAFVAAFVAEGEAFGVRARNL